MTLKNQWKTIKNNWLIIIILLVAAIFFYAGDNLLSTDLLEGYGESVEILTEPVGYAPSRIIKSGIYPPLGADSFAPEVEDRKITKTASISIEMELGQFQEGERQLKAIISSTNSFLLNENVNKYDRGKKSYHSGSYTLKVDVRKYDTVVSQLKEIGEVQSFSENTADITGTYTNIQTELEAERARLARYEQMLAEATEVADKIELSDRIFDQERIIKYLEESLENQDERVEYATIYMQITEKQSEFASIGFVTLGQLITNLVSSTSTVLELLFSVLPWAVVIVAVWLGVRWVKRR